MMIGITDLLEEIQDELQFTENKEKLKQAFENFVLFKMYMKTDRNGGSTLAIIQKMGLTEELLSKIKSELEKLKVQIEDGQKEEKESDEDKDKEELEDYSYDDWEVKKMKTDLGELYLKFAAVHTSQKEHKKALEVLLACEVDLKKFNVEKIANCTFYDFKVNHDFVKSESGFI
jgi:hypothetical protein